MFQYITVSNYKPGANGGVVLTVNGWTITITFLSASGHDYLNVVVTPPINAFDPPGHWLGICGDRIAVPSTVPGQPPILPGVAGQPPIPSWVVPDAENIFKGSQTMYVKTPKKPDTATAVAATLDCNTEAMTITPFDPFTTPTLVPITVATVNTAVVNGPPVPTLNAAQLALVTSNCAVINSGAIATICSQVMSPEVVAAHYANCLIDGAGGGAASSGMVNSFVSHALRAYKAKGPLPVDASPLLCPGGCYNRGTCRDNACECTDKNNKVPYCAFI